MRAHKGFEMSSSEQEVNLIKFFQSSPLDVLTFGVVEILKSIKQILENLKS